MDRHERDFARLTLRFALGLIEELLPQRGAIVGGLFANFGEVELARFFARQSRNLRKRAAQFGARPLVFVVRALQFIFLTLEIGLAGVDLRFALTNRLELLVERFLAFRRAGEAFVEFRLRRLGLAVERGALFGRSLLGGQFDLAGLLLRFAPHRVGGELGLRLRVSDHAVGLGARGLDAAARCKGQEDDANDGTNDECDANRDQNRSDTEVTSAGTSLKQNGHASLQSNETARRVPPAPVLPATFVINRVV